MWNNIWWMTIRTWGTSYQRSPDPYGTLETWKRLGLIVSCRARIPVFVVLYESSPETVLDTSRNFYSFWAPSWCVCVCVCVCCTLRVDEYSRPLSLGAPFIFGFVFFLKWASLSPNVNGGRGRAKLLMNCQVADQHLYRKQVWHRRSKDYKHLFQMHKLWPFLRNPW